MRAFLSRSFQRDAKAEGISDDDCRKALLKTENGLVDADLGHGLIKQRISRGGQGAARGLRTIIFYRRGRMATFLHVFAKSDKANLSKSELGEYVKLAPFLEKLTELELKELCKTKGWRELQI